MAENSAVHSSLLLSLTAELEKVARLCMLPSGWSCSPSLRLTPKGASLLVHWSPSLVAEKQGKDKGKRTKRRKRSAASQQRSAERAALHKARRASTVSSRQPLNPAAAPYVQVPVPPTPNPVPAAGVPAAEESERVGGSMEGQGLLGPVGLVDGVVRLSGPTVSVNAGDRGKRKKAENTEERAEVRRLCEGLFERWSNGREESQHAFSLRDQLDRLRGPGTTRSLHKDWAEEARKSRQRMQGDSG
jgi:hypothetical protein